MISAIHILCFIAEDDTKISQNSQYLSSDTNLTTLKAEGYKLVIFTPYGKCTNVEVSKEDEQNAVTIKLIGQEEKYLRVLIESPESRNVNWKIAFE